MPSQVVHLSESQTIQIADAPLDFFSARANVVSISDSPAFCRNWEESPRSEADGLGCPRGALSALVFELGGALLIYGAWYLCHLIRW